MRRASTLERRVRRMQIRSLSVSHQAAKRLRQAFRSLDRPDSYWTRCWITIDLIVIQCDSPTLQRAIRPLYPVRERLIHRRKWWTLVGRAFGKNYANVLISSFLETCPKRLCWELVKQSRRCAKDLHGHIRAGRVHASLPLSIRQLAYDTVTRSPHLSETLES